MAREARRARAPPLTDVERVAKHVIVDVSYARDALLCSCGEAMRAKGGIEWIAHRRAMGVVVKGLSYQGSPPKPTTIAKQAAADRRLEREAARA